MAKKRVRKVSRKKIVVKSINRTNKIQLIIKNLIFFLVLTILSVALLNASLSDLLIKIFFFLSLIFSFISLALLIVLLVILVLRLFK